MMKQAYICVNKDIMNSVNWAMKDFDGKLSGQHMQKPNLILPALAVNKNCCLVIIESHVNNEPTIEEVKKIKKQYPEVKILFVISESTTTKEELMSYLQKQLVDGVLVRPITVVKITENIYKLCTFKKAETPWYEIKKI